MSDQNQIHTHRNRLFVASCISLLTTSMVFANRGYKAEKIQSRLIRRQSNG